MSETSESVKYMSVLQLFILWDSNFGCPTLSIFHVMVTFHLFDISYVTYVLES